MMNTMRKNMKVILWVVVLAFLGTIFFVWGMDLGRREDVLAQQSAAVVNGTPISYEDFSRLYEQQYRSLFGERQEDPDPAEVKRLRSDLIDMLIDGVLLRQQATALGVEVFPEEVSSRIASMQAFSQNGRFSRERYLAVLSYSRISPAAFEAEQADLLLRLKMDQLLRDSVVVADADLRMYFQARSRKLKIQWAGFSWKDELANVSIPEERLEAYYQEHRQEFDQPEKMKASHILIGVKPDASEEDKLTAKIKLENLRNDIQKGADFAEVAKANSDDPGSKEQGGDLGFFAKGMMVEPFEKAAFALKPGQLSDIVETRFGYHLIKVTDRQEEKRSTFAGVKDTIRQRLREEEARQRQQARALSFWSLLREKQDLSAAGQAAGVKVSTTGWVTVNGPIPGLENSQQVLSQTFDLPLGKPSGSISAGDTICYTQIADEQPQPFNESLYQLEHDTLLEKFKDLRAEQARRDWLAQARQQAKIVNNIATEQAESTPETEPVPGASPEPVADGRP